MNDSSNNNDNSSNDSRSDNISSNDHTDNSDNAPPGRALTEHRTTEAEHAV